MHTYTHTQAHAPHPQDMTKSVEGPVQYLVIACKDPTPEKKHCLKLFQLKTTGGISLEPMKLYPMVLRILLVTPGYRMYPSSHPGVPHVSF